MDNSIENDAVVNIFRNKGDGSESVNALCFRGCEWWCSALHSGKQHYGRPCRRTADGSADMESSQRKRVNRISPREISCICLVGTSP